MSKWCQVGFQGSLLSAFFQKPLLPHIILMGGAKQASLDSLHRSLFGRFGFPSDNIKLCKTQQDFDEKSGFSKGDEIRACDAAIFWNRLPLHGVIVQGKSKSNLFFHHFLVRNYLTLWNVAFPNSVIQVLEFFSAQFDGFPHITSG